MILRGLLFLLFSLGALPASTQLLFNGTPVAFDKTTDTWLVTVAPETFGTSKTAEVSMAEGCQWEQLMIDGQTADHPIVFGDVSATSSYDVTYTLNGQEYCEKLMFTYLPVVRLTGQFGYEYAPAAVEVSTPDNGYQLMAAEIRWRGGSTNDIDKHKRNYKVKLKDADGDDMNRSFFSLRNDNVWILDAGQVDMFRMRNIIAAELWNDFARKPYYSQDVYTATRGKVVELFLNNEYQGIYNMCEPIDRKQVAVKKYDEETGAIHGGLWKSTGWGISTFWEMPPPYDNTQAVWDVFELKYPKIDDLCPSDWSTLYDAIHFVVTSSDKDFCDHIAEVIDLPVFIDYHIFANVLNAIDICGKNLYWAVYDKEESRKITPVMWDLDCTVGQNYVDSLPRPDYVHYTYPPSPLIYIDWRLQLLDPDGFLQTVADRYRQLRTEGALQTDSLKDRYRRYYQLVHGCGADLREEHRWSGDTDITGLDLNFAEEIAYIEDWLEHRLPLLDVYFANPTTVKDVTGERNVAEPEYYNLAGQKVSAQYQGIIIARGRKSLR